MKFRGVYFVLYTVDAFKAFRPTTFCFVLTSTFSAFWRVSFIETNVNKVIKLITMKTLQRKIPVLNLAPAQTYKNITSYRIHNV